MTDEKTSGGFDRDLLGDPADLRNENIGAPAFDITVEKQLLVSALRAAQWSQDRIARYLGCDPKTLRKHFSRELAAGADLIEGQAIEQVIAGMRAGNMPAVRKVLDLVRDGRVVVPAAPVEVEGDPADQGAAEEAAAAKIGKKEQLAEAAKKPGASWGSLLPRMN